jgi:hypothetical protein
MFTHISRLLTAVVLDDFNCFQGVDYAEVVFPLSQVYLLPKVVFPYIFNIYSTYLTYLIEKPKSNNIL